MQRSRSEFNMPKPAPSTYSRSLTDDDSGISVDYDYSSSTDLRSSRMTLAESPAAVLTRAVPFPIPNATSRQRIEVKPLVRFTSDGIVERIRPATMRNSQNGDYILCHSSRGTYIAYRTPIVPAWVTRLVREVELREQ